MSSPANPRTLQTRGFTNTIHANKFNLQTVTSRKLKSAAMALSSTFQERLQHLELTRNQRLCLLQAEKELQANQSQVLASKLANIRTIEQRCLSLDQKIASQNFKIVALKSEIESLDAKYDYFSQELRSLQGEVEELEELEKKKNAFYETNTIEMKEFKQNAERFVVKCQLEVENLRSRVNELRSAFMQLKTNNGNSCNSNIAAAEMRGSELLAAKENMDRNVASNYQTKAQLQKQLQSILMTQTEERSKPSQFRHLWEVKQRSFD